MIKKVIKTEPNVLNDGSADNLKPDELRLEDP